MQDLSAHLGLLKQHGYRQEESLILLMRLQFVKIIHTEIERRNWSQREAAKFLKIAQPRVAEIAAYATDRFSTEMLIKILHRLNYRTTFSVKPGKLYVRPARLKKPTSGLKKAKAKGGEVTKKKA